MTLLRTLLGEAEGTHYLIGQEKHADGHFHLHCFVERSSMIESRNNRYFDLEWPDATGEVITYHPNITSPRDRQHVKDYIRKDDKDPAIWPADWAIDEPLPKKSKWAEATPMLLNGDSAETILKSMPTFVLGNLKKVQEATAFIANIKAQELIPPLAEFLTWALPLDFVGKQGLPFHTIWNALRDNLANKGFGREQLYLHGPTGIGKSTFLLHLMQCIRTYVIPTEDFYCHWSDQLFDLSVMEEFKGQKSIQWLNQWLDGATLNVRKKGVPGTLKTNPVPTLLLSNFDINTADVYPNMQESVSIGTLRRRLRSLPVDQETMHALTQALRLFLSTTGRALPKMPSERSTPILPTRPLETVNPLWLGGH